MDLRNRKLLRPWHGPFRITGVDKIGVTAERVYGNSVKDPIRVHLQRVTRCPPAFPAGCFWYGDQCNGPGRPPKWIDDFVNTNTKIGSDTQPDEDHNDQPDIKDQRQEKPNDGKQSDGTRQTRPKSKGSKMKQMVPSQTRTRDVRPPNRYRS